MQLKLPAALQREFLAALQVLRPGSVAEELTEAVCISILRDRQRPSAANIQSFGGTGRPKSAGATPDNVDAVGVSEKEWALMQRARALEEELRLALCAAEDIRALKAKANHLLEHVRACKEADAAVQHTLRATQKRNAMLTSHAEKLMLVIRNLSLDKVKLGDRSKEERMLVFRLTKELAFKSRKLDVAKRTLVEMRANGQAMTRQLGLMEEKFRSLRDRFDVAREQQKGAIDRATKEASSLRKKFAAITRGKGRLDGVPLPPESPPVFAPYSVTLLQPGESSMDNSLANYNTGFPQFNNQRQHDSGFPQSNNQRQHGGGSPQHITPMPNGDKIARPATTGSMGCRTRPGSAPATQRRRMAATTEAPSEDLDKILSKIYDKNRAKSKDGEGARWTPDKLRALVIDASGHTGCNIPDITPEL